MGYVMAFVDALIAYSLLGSNSAKMWLRAPLLVALVACGGCGRDRALEAQPTAEQASSHENADLPVRNAFPTATKLRLFVEVGNDDKTGEPIFTKADGLLLTKVQRTEFESYLRIHTDSPDEAIAACFIPHHFFRYFDKAGKVVGEIQVCFCCTGVEEQGASNIKMAHNQRLIVDFNKLGAFIRSLGERTDIQCDDQNPER